MTTDYVMNFVWRKENLGFFETQHKHKQQGGPRHQL